MKQCFRDINFRKPVLAIIEQANTVIDRETAQKAHWLKLIPSALAKNPGPQ